MSATSWADAVRPGTPVKWRALEVAAFAPYPEVQEQLDPAGKYGRVRLSNRTRRRFAVAVPFMILIAALFIAPVFAFATLIGDRFGLTHPDPAVSVPTAGVIFAVAIPLLVISFVLWLRAGRPRDVVRQYQSGIALVLGAYSAYLIQTRGSSVPGVDWQLWIIPTLADALLGAVFVVMLSVSGRRARSTPNAGASSQNAQDSAAAERLRRVREQISLLTPDQQDAVRADIAVAVRDLHHRGVITSADADWAPGAGLGELALRMSQSRKTNGA